MAGDDPTKVQTDIGSASASQTDPSPRDLAALMGTAQFEDLVRKAAESLVTQMQNVASTADRVDRADTLEPRSQPAEPVEPVESVESVGEYDDLFDDLPGDAPDDAPDDVPAPPPADTTTPASDEPREVVFRTYPRESAPEPEAADALSSRQATAVAHEARNTLNEVVLFMKSLKQSSLTDTQRQRYISAQSSIAASQSTLDTVADIGNIEAGRFVSRPVEFELREALKPWVQMLTQGAAHRGIKIMCDVAPQVPERMIGDVQRLQRIFQYAVHYAIGFAKQGEVTIAISLIRDDATGTAIRVGIRNDGAGLQPDQTDQALLRRPMSHGWTSADEDRATTVAMYRKLCGEFEGGFGIDAVSTTGYEVWFEVTMQNPESVCGDRRAPGRHETTYLQCDLGDILDMSTGGLRVMSRKLLKGEVPVMLADMHGAIKLKASVVWVKKHGFRKFEIGLRFIELTPQTQSQIKQLWLDHSKREL